MPCKTPSTSRIVRRAAELTAAAVGLFCCMATSDVDEPTPGADPPPPPADMPDVGTPEPFFDDIQADLVLHNATADDQIVRIRTLRPAADLDCEVIAEDPGALVSEPLFGPAQTWTVPSDTNLVVDEHTTGSRPCYAAWIEADGLAPSVAFWRQGQPNPTTRPGAGLPTGSGVLVLQAAGPMLELDDGGEGFLYTPAEAPVLTEQCAAADDGHRVAWSTPVPLGDRRVEAMSVGLDGCISMTLLADGAEMPDPEWFVCSPRSALPFEVGETVRIENVYDAGVEGIRLSHDHAEFVLARGSTPPALADLEWTVEPEDGCSFGGEATCGTITRAAQLRASSPSFGEAQLRPGADAVRLFASDGRTLEMQSSVVQERAALDPECAFGPDVLGPDIELTITLVEE